MITIWENLDKKICDLDLENKKSVFLSCIAVIIPTHNEMITGVQKLSKSLQIYIYQMLLNITLSSASKLTTDPPAQAALGIQTVWPDPPLSPVWTKLKVSYLDCSPKQMKSFVCTKMVCDQMYILFQTLLKSAIFMSFAGFYSDIL